jgi:glycosyltransferase involved in cell wall biosynthesis
MSYLPECMASILGQSFQNFEVVANDDASSDGTYEFLQKQAIRDPRIRVIRNQRRLGLVKNWNQAVQRSCAAWIKFVFQDDLLQPNCLERMLSVAEQKQAQFVVCLRGFLFHRDTESDVRQRYSRNAVEVRQFASRGTVSPEEFVEAILARGICVNFIGEPITTLFRRELFDRYGPFNRHVIQTCDAEYWYRIGSHVGVTFVSEVLATFRVHRNSATAENMKRRFFRFLLDPLIVTHDFVYSRHYDALRQIVRLRFGEHHLGLIAHKKVWDIWEELEEKEARQLPDAVSCRREWNAVCRAYPRIRLMLWRCRYWKFMRSLQKLLP